MSGIVYVKFDKGTKDDLSLLSHHSTPGTPKLSSTCSRNVIHSTFSKYFYYFITLFSPLIFFVSVVRSVDDLCLIERPCIYIKVSNDQLFAFGPTMSWAHSITKCWQLDKHGEIARVATLRGAVQSIVGITSENAIAVNVREETGALAAALLDIHTSTLQSIPLPGVVLGVSENRNLLLVYDRESSQISLVSSTAPFNLQDSFIATFPLEIRDFGSDRLVISHERAKLEWLEIVDSKFNWKTIDLSRANVNADILQTLCVRNTNYYALVQSQSPNGELRQLSVDLKSGQCSEEKIDLGKLCDNEWVSILHSGISVTAPAILRFSDQRIVEMLVGKPVVISGPPCGKSRIVWGFYFSAICCATLFIQNLAARKQFWQTAIGPSMIIVACAIVTIDAIVLGPSTNLDVFFALAGVLLSKSITKLDRDFSRICLMLSIAIFLLIGIRLGDPGWEVKGWATLVADAIFELLAIRKKRISRWSQIGLSDLLYLTLWCAVAIRMCFHALL